VSDQLHAPAALPPVPIIDGWVGPRTGMDEVKEKSFSRRDSDSDRLALSQSMLLDSQKESIDYV
jgi:hypothetical protein